MVEEQNDNRYGPRRHSNGNESSLQQTTLTANRHAHSAPPSLNSRLGRPTAQNTLHSNTSAIQSSSDFHHQRTKKNKRGHRARNNDDTYFFLLLILSSLSPDKLQYPATSYPNMSAMESQSNVRTLFDPMIGEFCADTSPDVLNKFFSSKMRYRDDIGFQKEIQANMMVMTEQAPIYRSTATNSSGANNPQPSDPTTLDYDAIDVYWRRDIENEKGIAPVHPMNYSQGCSSSNDVSEQFYRDLQLLTEKSLLTPLTHEENFRYENLSKAHYADFYRTVVPQVAAKRWQSASNTSSTSGYSNNTERPMSPAKSNISSFDENEAANFFTNLAKESMMEQSRQAVQPLPTYSNLTLCADQSSVLNNVSLAQQANLPGVLANDTFFMSNTTSNGIRGSAAYETSAQQQDDEVAVTNEILDGIADQPLEISESDANAIWTTMQNSEDLSDAVQLHEFIGMEILGEFQQNATTYPDVRLDSPIPENIMTYVERETSPSSGIGSSMQSSSSSPNHNDEFGYVANEEQHDYRVYNKLVPKVREQRASFSTDASADSFKRPQSSYQQRKQTKSRMNDKQDGVAQRKRGRQSKDEQLAQDHNLPASAEEFAAMSHLEIQKFMRDPKLTALQKSLIKKIRRRGRNKIAARKCRLNRTDQQDEYFVKEELQSNFDPSDLSLYDY